METQEASKTVESTTEANQTDVRVVEQRSLEGVATVIESTQVGFASTEQGPIQESTETGEGSITENTTMKEHRIDEATPRADIAMFEAEKGHWKLLNMKQSLRRPS